MKPIQAAKKFIRQQIRKAFDPMENIDLNNIIGWRSVGGSKAYGYYQDNQYENGYSSISKLGNGFAQIEQYTIDKDAKGIASNILDRLYTPNTDMSSYDFREALAVCFLVMDKVRIRVHHKTSRITADSILGFTFMEDYSETIVGGKRHYRMPNGDTLTDKEVITLKSVNPDKVTDGFSASRAAKRWTKLDDLIADYQRGFFANGAVPAGEMIITARTPAEFNDIVDKLEEKHQGAGRNNNITYTHRPTNQNGEPQNAQIEWVPFSTGNKDMALKDLFENVNKKIDSAYGVPAEIRGFLSNSNYASVGVAEKVFVKYALYPMTMKIWTKFTHELNRITGGTGVAITFDLPIPTLADEELINAQAKQTEGVTVANLTAQGITIESAVEYVQTGDLSILVVGTKDDDDKPDILTAEEAKDTPEQPIDIYSKSIESIEKVVTKLVKAIGEQSKNITKPEPVKNAKVKAMSNATRQEYEAELANVVRRRMETQVENVIKNYDGITKAISTEQPIEAIEDALLSSEMQTVLVSLISFQGDLEHEINTQIILRAGISDENVGPFRMTAAQRKKYNAYVDKVAEGYNAETSEKIRQIIRLGRENDLTAAEIKRNLRTVLDEEYRVTRIAVSEVNRAGNTSSLYSMQEIADQTGASVEKVWEHSGGDDPCEFCRAMIGTTVPLNDNFLDLDASVRGVDGGEFVNNFVPIDVAELHPNGHCRQTYRVRR